MKWIIYLILGVLFCSFAYSVEMDEGCSNRGFAYTYGAWTYNGSWNGYGVDLVGGPRKINWTSDVLIDGVVYKSNGRTYLLDGGYNGTVPKTTLSNDFEWVVFCTNTSEVPEFGVIGAVIVVVLGLLIWKKQNI